MYLNCVNSRGVERKGKRGEGQAVDFTAVEGGDREKASSHE